MFHGLAEENDHKRCHGDRSIHKSRSHWHTKQRCLETTGAGRGVGGRHLLLLKVQLVHPEPHTLSEEKQRVQLQLRCVCVEERS